MWLPHLTLFFFFFYVSSYNLLQLEAHLHITKKNDCCFNKSDNKDYKGKRYQKKKKVEGFKKIIKCCNF